MDTYRNRFIKTSINWGQPHDMPAINPLQEWLVELDPTLGWLFQKNGDGLQEQGISMQSRVGIARTDIRMKTADRWLADKAISQPTFIKEKTAQGTGND